MPQVLSVLGVCSLMDSELPQAGPNSRLEVLEHVLEIIGKVMSMDLTVGNAIRTTDITIAIPALLSEIQSVGFWIDPNPWNKPVISE